MGQHARAGVQDAVLITVTALGTEGRKGIADPLPPVPALGRVGVASKRKSMPRLLLIDAPEECSQPVIARRQHHPMLQAALVRALGF
jgi:hypothetical protein